MRPEPKILPVRYVREVGTRGRLRIYWSWGTFAPKWCDDCKTNHLEFDADNASAPSSCANSYGGGHRGAGHNAYAPLADVPELGAFESFGKPEDYGEDLWPTACAHCGAAVPPLGKPAGGGRGADANRQVFPARLYDTPSGEPAPGDVYFAPCVYGSMCWVNCPGRHLWVVLPNGHPWDIDGRANNCKKPDDKIHRCWMRTGDPEMSIATLDVGKGTAAETCPAGGGSISVPGYHGFLRQGALRSC
jgi:hypothetical protein